MTRFGIVCILLLLAAPFATEAQQAERVYRVGILSAGTDPAQPATWAPFIGALRELGYTEGKNLVVEPAYAAGHFERIPGMVAGLVRKNVDVIVTSGSRETRAAAQATRTIPIVMTVVGDPVAEGFVASLARPGGNVTGTTLLVPGLSQKYVELMKEAAPEVSRVAIVASPPNPLPGYLKEMEAAGHTLGMSVSVAHLRQPGDLEPTFARLRKEGIGGIIVPNDALTFLHRAEVARLAAKHRMPAIYAVREYVEAGGLLAYGASKPSQRRNAAGIVDKILRGAKPAELAVVQPTEFELVINQQAARQLGLTLPQSLLLRATQVIE